MVANATRCAARRRQIAALSVLLALIAGCRVPPSPDSSRTPGGASNSTNSTDAARPPQRDTAVGTQSPARDGLAAWPVDPERTVVTVIVRRSGPLARLGHDHVITSSDERGTVWMGATPGDSSFELQLPVERFDVDLPAARAVAGPEFAAPVPDEARDGTRRNMLRTEVLDGATFPSIMLRSVAASGDWAQPLVRIAITLRGMTRDYDVPVAVERDPRSVVARGELRFNQSEFGITPFAVAGGALQVADALEVRFELAARAP